MSKTGPRPGSRPWQLVNLAFGECLVIQVPRDKAVSTFMQQINTDILRNGLKGKVTQQHLIGVQPSTREVVDLVRVSRIEE